MVRRSGCAPQFNRSLPYQLTIRLLARSLRSDRGGGRMAIQPVEKILFDDRKLRAADRIDVVTSDDIEFARLKRVANDPAALSLLTLRRWRTSAMASPNDSNEGVGSTALSFDAVTGRA